MRLHDSSWIRQIHFSWIPKVQSANGEFIGSEFNENFAKASSSRFCCCRCSFLPSFILGARDGAAGACSYYYEKWLLPYIFFGKWVSRLEKKDALIHFYWDILFSRNKTQLNEKILYKKRGNETFGIVLTYDLMNWNEKKQTQKIK